MSQEILAQLERPSSKYPRKYAPNDLNLKEWSALEPQYQGLLSAELTTLNDLEAWIMNWSEMDAIVNEEGSRLYINMTCDTGNEDAAQAFSHFVENIEPKLSPILDQLRKKLVACPVTQELSDDYQVWLKDIQAQLELFKEENIDIETKLALEVQNYQKVTGSMTVEWKGETSTLQKVGAELENTDRSIREEAWRLVQNRRLQDKEVLNQHFDQMFQMRQKISANCGFNDFLDYIYKAKGRYDYTPQNCYDFHDAVEKCVVPKYRKLLAHRAEKLGLKKLRPWDLSVDTQGRSPLKPFDSIDKLISGVSQVFHGINEDFGKKFDTMKELGLLDLDSRLGKAPGGYQCGLEEFRMPFIFMNAVGTNSDLFTLLHEGGHSLHQFFMMDQDLTAYRDIMSEIAEVASMSMELVGTEFLHHIYPDPEDAQRAKLDQFEDVIKILPWVATIDAFQHWMYTHPNHTPEERNAYWLELDERFGAGDIIDWTGLEDLKPWQWQRQLHLFEVPFYYIEYGIAQLGALGVYKNFKEDPQKAMDQYQKGLALGGSQELPTLFEATGIPFDFSEATVAPLMNIVDEEIARILNDD